MHIHRRDADEAYINSLSFKAHDFYFNCVKLNFNGSLLMTARCSNEDEDGIFKLWCVADGLILSISAHLCH